MTTALASDRLADLLQLTQWLSPAFPLGAFAYSHGLETAISQGDIACAESLRAWLRDILERGSGRNDAVLLSLALRQAEPDADLAALAAALASSQERWVETLAQGTAFVRTTDAILGTQTMPAALPVVLGIQARRLRLAPKTVIALYLQGFAGNLIAVATRAVPLGQTEAQGVLAALAPDIAALAEALAFASVTELSAAVPRAEIFAMKHETAEVRLFSS